jgi:hypothetical protein
MEPRKQLSGPAVLTIVIVCVLVMCCSFGLVVALTGGTTP